MITAKVEQRALDNYLKLLDKNRGKPLLVRAEKVTLGAARRVLVPALRSAAPRGTARKGHKAGTLQRMSKAKLLRKRGTEDIRPTWVGSGAYYTHMLIGGTRAHLLATREAGRTVTFEGRRGPRSFTATLQKSTYAVFADGEVRPLAGMEHPGSRANPFVARAIDPNLDIVYSLISKDVWETS